MSCCYRLGKATYQPVGDAYKIEETSFLEILKLLDDIRAEIRKDALERMKVLYASELYRLLDFRATYGVEKCREMLQSVEEEWYIKKDKKQRLMSWDGEVWEVCIWEKLAQEELDESGLRETLANCLKQKIKYCSDSPDPKDMKYYYRGILVLFPLEDKTLCVYFGDDEFEKRVKENKAFSDYNYLWSPKQDDSDKVSNEELGCRINDWQKTNWRKARSTPAMQGYTVELFDYNDIYYMMKEISSMNLTSPVSCGHNETDTREDTYFLPFED